MSATDSKTCPTSDAGSGEPANESGAQGASNSAEDNSLEGLLTTLSKQIKSSDWLQKNTAEKWMAENPETAKEIMLIMEGKQAAPASQDAQQSSSPSQTEGQ